MIVSIWRKIILNDLNRVFYAGFKNLPDIGVADLSEIFVSTPAVVSRRLSKLCDDGIIVGQETIIGWQ